MIFIVSVFFGKFTAMHYLITAGGVLLCWGVIFIVTRMLHIYATKVNNNNKIHFRITVQGIRTILETTSL